MKKIYYFNFVLCCLLTFISRAEAQIFSPNQPIPQQFVITQVPDLGFLPGPGIEIFIPQGVSLFATTPDLTQLSGTLAATGLLFDVSPGDFLSNSTINSFAPLAGGDNFINNLPSIPFGESIIGFASRDGGSPYDTFGYAQILRTPGTIEVLSTDSVFAGFDSPPDASFGITVPTPEPSSAFFGALALMAVVMSRRRS